MARILLISDWHVGASLYRCDRSSDHAAVLAETIAHARAARPDLIIHTGGHDTTVQHYTPGPPTRAGVWMQYDIVVTGNHYEVTLTDTDSGVSQLTTTFDNTDAQRGVAKINGAPAGFIGIQSYPNSPVAFRDIWIK